LFVLHVTAPSAPVNIKKEQIQPSDSTGPHVKITWGSPSNSNGIITGYKVSFGDPKEEKTLDKNTFNASFSVCGEKTYQFEVWAFNSKEQGEKATGSVLVPSYGKVSTIRKVIEGGEKA